MAKRTSPRGAREIAREWLTLAEKRRAHLIELRESGRWQRYYSEASLAAQIRDAERCIAEWKDLAAPAEQASAAPKTPTDVAA